MKATGILVGGLLVLSALVQSQGIQKRVVLHDGYQGDRIVRNHVEVHYTHTSPKLTDGYVVVTKVVEVPLEESNRYEIYLQTDTLLHFSGEIKKGLKQGTFLSFPPGNIFYCEAYVKDRKQGVSKGYFTTGVLYSETTLRNDVPVGEYRQYYANGKPSIYTQKLNRKSTVMHYEDYYTNGQLYSKGLFYNDMKVNEWQYFDKQGQAEKTEYYTNRGRLISVKGNDLRSISKLR